MLALIAIILISFAAVVVILALLCKLLKSRFAALATTMIGVMSLYTGYLVWSQEQNSPPDYDAVFMLLFGLFFMLGNALLIAECVVAASLLDRFFDWHQKKKELMPCLDGKTDWHWTGHI